MHRWRTIDRTIWAATLAETFDRLDARELQIVRRYVAHMQRRPLRRGALIINHLSNGALYPLVAMTILAIFGWPLLPSVAVAASTVVIAHLIYPQIKVRCRRARPFECDPTIVSLLKPLDRHSFPSGHTMTATAAFLPLSAANLHLMPFAIAGIASIGWARLAAGHHYPTDVIAGALLGSVIAGPGIIWLTH